MKIVRSDSGWFFGILVAAAMAAAAQGGDAQNTKMPSTLRYGSGYMDVPVASVLPHLGLTGTVSGFKVDVDNDVITDSQGNIVGLGDPVSDWYMDGSVALGLFDRVEVGTTLQSFNDSNAGGNMWGAFGRLALLRPEDQGIGLAGGVQWIAAPEFDDTVSYQPPRLGFPDRRFREGLFDGPDADDDIQSELTFYGVASAFLRGLESDFLPDWDATISGGWGNGIFNEGERTEFYRYTDSEGWFVGGALHVAVTDNSLLNLMSEWNGFDLNFGAQLDLSGIRLGGHVLGANYWSDQGIYRSPKYGFLGSLCLDLSGSGSFLCQPELMARIAPDTVQLPAPPPDTVTVTREVAPPLPTGTPTDICLATGEVVTVYVTAQGDTLVGPNRVSVRTLRPGVVFAGEYAQGRDWFEADQPLTFERRQYSKSGGEVRLDCPNIIRVGEFMGVPLFADRTATTPYQTLYVPVRPGIWQAYQSGLQQTRG